MAVLRRSASYCLWLGAYGSFEYVRRTASETCSKTQRFVCVNLQLQAAKQVMTVLTVLLLTVLASQVRRARKQAEGSWAESYKTIERSVLKATTFLVLRTFPSLLYSRNASPFAIHPHSLFRRQRRFRRPPTRIRRRHVVPTRLLPSMCAERTRHGRSGQHLQRMLQPCH